MSNHDIPVKEIGELLDEVSAKIPKLLEGINQIVYAPEAGAKAGKAVGSFYKELMDAGLPEDVAVRLAEKFMFSLNDVMKFVNVKE